MVVKIYISGISGNKEVSERQLSICDKLDIAILEKSHTVHMLNSDTTPASGSRHRRHHRRRRWRRWRRRRCCIGLQHEHYLYQARSRAVVEHPVIETVTREQIGDKTRTHRWTCLIGAVGCFSRLRAYGDVMPIY